MKKLLVTLVAGVLLGLSPALVRADPIDLQKLLSETQRMDQGGGKMRLVWWVPTDYWRESFRKSPTLNQERAEALCKTVDDYVVVMLVDGKFGPAGAFAPLPRSALEGKISITVGDQKDIKPLATDALTPDARNFFTMMKPLLSNMLGQVGSGIEIFCFPNKDAHGQLVVDPRKPGMLQVTYAEQPYQFRMPLGSLLPPRYDPNTGESFPGNYVFSPYTGVKLVDTPPAKPSGAYGAPGHPAPGPRGGGSTDCEAPMSKANVDPSELRRFAQELKRFTEDIESLVSQLHGRMNSLEGTWRDQEQKKFAEAFNQTTKALAMFVEAAGEHAGFLNKKAEAIEQYLRQR